MNEKKKTLVISACIENVQSGFMSREQCLLKYPNLADEIRSTLSTIDIISSITFSEEEKIDRRLQKVNLMQKLPDREEFVTKRIDHRYRLHNLKRRFMMTWVVIVTTILSLISGAGAVYASNEALPGDILYPVKMWAENVQLAIAPDDVDMDLYVRFANNRIEEAGELVREGRSEDLGDAVIGYQQRIELLTQAMVHIQAEDPDEAVRLRLELEEKLQAQARLMQSFIEDEEDAEETNDQLCEQIRLMLETNMQLRLRINEVEDVLPEEPEDLGGDTETALDASALEVTEVEEAGKNGNGVPSIEVNDENGTLVVGLDGRGGNGVYAEVNGLRFDCVVDGDTATCNMDGAPQQGNANLYDKQTNQLLYSCPFEFEHAFDWDGEKNDNGNNGENLEDCDGDCDGEGGMGTNMNGKK
ncbi:MAG: DUF5667 domain-containing protein [Pelolinea sp.]|nr:DUF5667 domain-containing protein [Pelolinea sp.]